MEAKFTLPPDITQGATARGNEYGWTLDAFPQAYSGLALETRISAEYRLVEGQVRRSKKLLSIRGLNKDRRV